MRPHTVFLVYALLVSCHQPTEVRGLYINGFITGDSAGVFFPCDDPKVTVIVQDSALRTRYRTTAAANEPVFVRLRGVHGHSGSIYGGQRLFEVQQILEV